MLAGKKKLYIFLFFLPFLFFSLFLRYSHLQSEDSFNIIKNAFQYPPRYKKINYYDSKGKLFYKHTNPDNFAAISLREIDPKFIKDLIFIEDKNFFYHSGFDLAALVRSSYQYFFVNTKKFFNLISGRMNSSDSDKISGASTITQQLIKNILYTPRRNIWNKLQEIILAYRLENYLSRRLNVNKSEVKKKILTMYLNYFFAAYRIYGLQNAVEVFFDKRSAVKLSPDERTLLLALIHAPGIINGDNSAAKIKIIQRIHERLRKGDLRPVKGTDTVRLALTKGWQKRRRQKLHANSSNPEPAYAAVINRMFFEKDFIGKKNIYTYRNSVLTKKLNQEFLSELKRLNKGQSKRYISGAYVLLDLNSAKIMAMGDDPFTPTLELYETRRQIASTFKPFIYTVAFEKLKLHPASVLQDEKTLVYDVHGKAYSPSNSYPLFQGNITLKSALQYSSNTISIQIMKGLNMETLVARGKAIFRLQRNEDLDSFFFPDYSLALGSMQLSPLHLTAGYTVLLSGGKKKYPRFFKGQKIEIDEGASILDSGHCHQVREMLTSVVRVLGTGAPFIHGNPNLIIKDIGAKSGSTFRDSWFAGFSQDLLLVVWLGYYDEIPHSKIRFHAANIWKKLFLQTQDQYPPKPLQYPKSLVRKYFCKKTGLSPSKDCMRIQSALFVPGTGP